MFRFWKGEGAEDEMDLEEFDYGSDEDWVPDSVLERGESVSSDVWILFAVTRRKLC